MSDMSLPEPAAPLWKQPAAEPDDTDVDPVADDRMALMRLAEICTRGGLTDVDVPKDAEPPQMLATAGGTAVRVTVARDDGDRWYRVAGQRWLRVDDLKSLPAATVADQLRARMTPARR